MGTTLTNLHLYARTTGQQVHAQCVDTVRAHLATRFEEVPPADAIAIVVVASDLHGPWASVYLDWQMDPPGMATALSRVCACPVVLIEVFDSDVLTVRLVDGGETIDVFSDWANFDDVPKQRSGNAARWVSVLPDGRTPDDLARAWQPDNADYPFESEGTLQRVADVLTIDPDRIWFEARYEEFETADTRVTELYLRPTQGV